MEREGDEGGDREGRVWGGAAARFVCEGGEVMYECVEVKRVAFAEML